MTLFLLFALPILILSATVHEFAHGLCAYKLGDSTAKSAGRLTLNPIPHIDPIGTVFLPLMLIFLSTVPGFRPFVIAWAKPVPINPGLLRRPKTDMIWVSISGIAANIALAFIFSLLLRAGTFTPNTFGWLFLNIGIYINVLLAVFNAIPIPPLDGSKILANILPRELAYTYIKLERFGFLILILFLYLGLFDIFVWPTVMSLVRFLGGNLL